MAMYSICGAISFKSGGFLEMSEFERSIPFLTWSIWIYIGLYPLYLTWALLSYKNETEMNKTLYAFAVLGITSCSIFLIFPVSYPRDLFPLVDDGAITTILFQITRMIDKPSNCLPSLHVGLCFLFAYGFWKEDKTKFWISIFCSTLIAISTLTTKQHYILDILTSFILSTSIYIFFQRKVVITQTSDT